MRARLWLVVGVLLGIAVAAGRVPYLAGAGRSLAASAEHLVLSAANHLISGAAHHGAPERAVLAVGGLLTVLVPGLTSLLLIVAARTSLRLRAVVALLVVAVGAASYVYQPHGEASGVLLLALAIAGLAVTLTGPLVAAPLALGAGLIAAEFLPTLFAHRAGVTKSAVEAVHAALWGHPGDPVSLQVALLIVAVLPMAYAARLVAECATTAPAAAGAVSASGVAARGPQAAT